MKKVFFSFLFLTVATTMLLVACSKSSDTQKSTTVNCTDSAYLLPDSLLGCAITTVSNYKLFYLTATRKNLLVPKGTFTDIDTVVNGGQYLINYDSVGIVPLCGAILTKIDLTCHTKL
ncbi:MAG: hypothetical protein ACOVO1_10330 [Chitinophagaceae bacterium]